ncbi:MAG: AAA family ATPase [Pseudomonadota bacterium]
MIHTVAISGYRSLRDIVIPVGQLTIVTGSNGTGKSSIYKSLRLLADIADDRAIRSLAREGGFKSVLWAGPETLSRGMRDGSVPIQGTRRKGPISLKLGFASDEYSYAIELGLPPRDGRSMFNDDPEIKREVLWFGDKPTPAKIISDRRGPSLRVRTDDRDMLQMRSDMSPYDSMVREAVGPDAPWEIAVLRERLSNWRFYDHIRTDEDAPARSQQIGTRTVALSPSGEDVAAAIQTIYEIGNGEALDAAIAEAFDGAKLEVEASEGGVFQLLMRQRGMLRPLGTNELSDGTLRFVLLAASLLSPRPSQMLVLNEPEASLHSSVMPALAGLIINASEVGQVITVSHNRTLVTSLLSADAELVELYKDTGETRVQSSDSPRWDWPAR